METFKFKKNPHTEFGVKKLEKNVGIIINTSTFHLWQSRGTSKY